MGLNKLVSPFAWSKYSKKLIAKIENPRSAGIFKEAEAEARQMRLVLGEEGAVEAGNFIRFYWLVDKEDGIIVDVRYQVLGQSALIGAAEGATDLLVGKNYDQAMRMSADLIDKSLRDKSDIPSFPKECYPHLNLIVGAIEAAAENCTDLPFASTYVAPPVPAGLTDVVEGGYPGFFELSLKKKLIVIEQVLDQDVRPYIALDGGGVEVLNLIQDKEVVIAYQGACTSCYSSVGTTLSYIQQILKNKVHPNLVVVPDLNFPSA